MGYVRAVLMPHSGHISSSGLQVKSSVLGVVILVISLAFFYLYLDNVYPITERPGLSEATESSR